MAVKVDVALKKSNCQENRSCVRTALSSWPFSGYLSHGIFIYEKKKQLMRIIRWCCSF